MKKTLIGLTLLSTAAAFAQVSPLQGHMSTDITKNEGRDIWQTMKGSFEKDSECYNRAQSWTYDINKKYGFEGKKILIHYSRKYNEELSAKWGFHIAPVYKTEGVDTVYDKGFRPWIHAPLTKKMWEQKFLIAGTEKLVEKRIKLKEKLLKAKKTLRELDPTDEYSQQTILATRKKITEYKAEMVDFKITDNDLKAQKPKKIAQVQNWVNYFEEQLATGRHTGSTLNSLRYQLKYQKNLLSKVKSNLDYAAHIECKKITNIEELDFNINEGWCFIQEVSQYYWGVPQLRLLNYGVDQIRDIPNRSELRSARIAGENHIREDFDMNQVWIARKQAFGKDYETLWKTEFDLKENSADAVSDIYDINKSAIKKIKEANKLYSKIVKASKGLSVTNTELKKAKANKDSVTNNADLISKLKEKIYSVAQSIEVEDTKTKVNSFKEAKKVQSTTQRMIDSLKGSLSKVKTIVKEHKARQREIERERRRNNRD